MASFSSPGTGSRITSHPAFSHPVVPKNGTTRLGRPSGKIVDTIFSPHPPANTKDVGRQALRIEFDVVARTSPDVAHVSQEIVHLVGLARVKMESIQRQINPRGLSSKWIQIHHDDNDVQQIIGHLAVDDDLAVVREMKAQVPVTLQGRVSTANLI